MSAKKMCQRWSVLLHFVQFFNIKKKKNVVKKTIMQSNYAIMLGNYDTQSSSRWWISKYETFSIYLCYEEIGRQSTVSVSRIINMLINTHMHNS